MHGRIKATAHACGISTRSSHIAIAGQLSEALSSWNAIEKENSPSNSESHVTKKPRLSISLKKTHQRFGESVSGNLSELTMPVIPDNTKKNTSRAMRNFKEWRSDREKVSPECNNWANVTMVTLPWIIFRPRTIRRWKMTYCVRRGGVGLGFKPH